MTNFKMIIFAFSISLCSMPKLMATIILPLSLEDQMRTSDGIVEGTIQGKSFKRLASGEVATEVTIKLDKVVGLDQEILINPSQFKVMVPGGEWGGVTHRVDGVPPFTKGEEVVLFVSKFKYGIKLSSMGLSKYQLFRQKSDVTLKSYLFPDHPHLGTIKYSEFSKLVSNVLNKDLAPLANEKTVWKRPDHEINDEEIGGRAPASLSPTSHIEMSWLIVIFAMLGSGSWYLAKKD